MQQLIKLLLLSVFLCLVPSESIAQKSSRKTRKPSPPPIICKIESVPHGMVVVGYKRNSACSDGAELLVKRPENGDIICAESPLPPQFSVTTEAQGGSVGTCPSGAFLISGTSRGSAQVVNDDPIGRAFASRASDIQVEGEGTVTRLLADDLNGSRHQRFIVQLASGQTLLISHNIDVAPRIDGLAVGDSVRFYGEYVWNEKGACQFPEQHTKAVTLEAVTKSIVPSPLRSAASIGWVVHDGKTYK